MINSRKIEDLHPKLQELCRKHVEACRARGVFAVVTSTLRDQEYQASLYAQGRTKPGSIVTKMQLIGPHGFGLAYDVAPVTPDGKTILWNDTAKWKIIGEEGKKLGLTWGGDWKSFVDKPHFELTEGLTAKQLRAGKRTSWWDVKSKVQPIPKVVLKKGMKCDEVKLLQELLNNHEYQLIPDGDFGFMTETAVKGYQKSKGLVADGVVGPKTWSKLYEG
jgi:peptidoglycan L-alanyl-D-glutamate endopeptidase CwlK